MATPVRALPDGAAETTRGVELRPVAARAARRRGAPVWLLFSDVLLASFAYVLALQVRSDTALGHTLGPTSEAVDWSMAIVLGITFVVFYVFGLYETEILISRGLHLWTVTRATAFSFLFSAGVIYILKLPIAFQSRAVVFGTFALFFVLASCVRVGLVPSLLGKRLGLRGKETLVVGRTARTEALRERMKDLRGFSRIRTLDSRMAHGHLVDRLASFVQESAKDGTPAFTRVFIDAGSISHQDVLSIVSLCRHQGIDVFVVSRLLRPLNVRRLLFDLFEAPVVKMKRGPEEIGSSGVKRLFDIVVAALALVMLSPFMAVIAIAVKVTSRGPIIFAQERIGRRGEPFKFYKFRSMKVSADESVHEEYVKELINGNGKAQLVEHGDEEEEIFKIVDDPRITRVGAFLRKYSLDELPQFWNVLKGDMSVVGPRPALPYEVKEYKSWHRERLLPTPGVSGLWQVQGRSRVTFDEMVFQDVMYGCAQDALADTVICLRTIPAALVGSGAV